MIRAPERGPSKIASPELPLAPLTPYTPGVSRTVNGAGWRWRVLAALTGAFAVACGLSAVGAADSTPEGVDEGGVEASLPEGSIDPSDADGGNAQSECPAPSVVCDGVCTDTLADPANCAACGKVCPSGDTCEDGGCAVLCVAETIRCNGQCINPKTNPANCGACGAPCADATPLCLAGTCVQDCGTSKLCTADGGIPDAGTPASYCTDTMTDRMNCGDCGVTCLANEVCEAGACKALCAVGSRPGDVFDPTMVGCVGKVSFVNRTTLCAPGSSPCGAADWVARRAGKAPSYNYWTNDNLGYYGNSNNCLVDTKNVYGCGSSPMRVCEGRTDPLGNQCTWTSCGYKTYSPDQEFGGCTNNPTAGTLCCK
jgi:hypothetical protein